MTRIARPALGRFSRHAFYGTMALLLAFDPAAAQVTTNGPIKTLPQANAPRVQLAGSLAAANASVTLPVDGMSTGLIQVSGTFVGTLSWFGSVDGGTTYFAINATPFGAGLSGPSVSTATAPGQWELATAPLTHVRATLTSYTSGTASVLLAGSNGTKLARVRAPATDPLPVTIVSGGGSGGTANPFPGSDYATSARQDSQITALGAPADAESSTGNGSVIGLSKAQRTILSNLYASIGTAADAASVTTGANGTQIALLKALRDKLNGTVAVSGAVTANIGTTNGLALDASVQQVRTALGSPFQANGSIGNTAFGISGTLPAFAATPTFNVGTTGGLALDTTLTARFGTLGQKTMAGSAPVAIASDQGAVPVSGTFFQATQPISATTLPLPTGAATLAGQTQISTRAAFFADYGAATTANQVFTGTPRDLGTAPTYSRLNVGAITTQSGTLSLQSCIDSGCTSIVTLAQSAIAAGQSGTVTAIPISRYWRVLFVNGATAGSANIISSTTAN